MNCTQSHAMHGIPMLRIEFSLSFIEFIGWEKKWVFFNNQTLFLRCIVKIISINCQIYNFFRDYDGFQLI